MPSTVTRLFFGIGCLTPFLGLTLLGFLFYNGSFAVGIASAVISFIVMLFLVGFGSQLEQKQKQKQLEYLQTFQPEQFDSRANKSFTSYDLLTKIAIDEQQKKVHIWTPDPELVGDVKKAYMRMPYIIHTFNYSDLLAVNLKEDNRRTASVHRDTHFTHFLLNKLLEDDLRKNSTTKPPVDKISSMDLEVIVDNKTTPRHLIRFYYAPYIYIRKDSPEYEAYLKERQQWFTKLRGIIENGEAVEMERPIETVEPVLATTSSNEGPTQTTADVDTTDSSIQFQDESKEVATEIPEVQDENQQPQPAEKPLSYFEQLIEKNRRQLRGDSNDE